MSNNETNETKVPIVYTYGPTDEDIDAEQRPGPITAQVLDSTLDLDNGSRVVEVHLSTDPPGESNDYILHHYSHGVMITQRLENDVIRAIYHALDQPSRRWIAAGRGAEDPSNG